MNNEEVMNEYHILSQAIVNNTIKTMHFEHVPSEAVEMALNHEYLESMGRRNGYSPEDVFITSLGERRLEALQAHPLVLIYKAQQSLMDVLNGMRGQMLMSHESVLGKAMQALNEMSEQEYE